MTKKCTKHSAARLQSVLKDYYHLKNNYNELLVKLNHQTLIIAKQDELIKAQSDYINTREKLIKSETLYKNKSKRDELHAALLKQIKAFPIKKLDIPNSKRDELHSDIKAFPIKKQDTNDVNDVNRRQMDLLLQELKDFYSNRILKGVNEPIIVDETYIKTEAVPVNTVSHPSRKTCSVM